MTHAFVTVSVPFDDGWATAVEHQLDQLGNLAKPAIRDLLRDKGIHFISMTVIRGDTKHGAFLVLEASVDGSLDEAIGTIATQLRVQLEDVLRAAGLDQHAAGLERFLKRHSHKVGHGLFSTPGLCFTGTPGMSVDRIKREYELGRYVRDLVGSGTLRGTPLQILKAVRTQVATDPRLTPLLNAEPAELLQPAPPDPGLAGLIPKLAWSATRTFLWPYLVPAGLISLAVAVWAWCASGLLFGIGMFFLAAGIAALLLVALLALFYGRLRALEAADQPDDTTPDSAVLEAANNLEDNGDQNHLAGISVMKPGLMRRLTLRIAYWTITQLAGAVFRPGHLGDIGTIHFARWILLPGTDKLLFFSNYGGSWESYLEDFITKASEGLTGVWSNTYGYPRTKNLFFEGARDGDRFKRWARRQQCPTRFWYSAYPNTTTARVRANAAIRLGLASATTEDEAADWLSQLGSRVRSANTIQTDQVQAILFGGMGKLADATCLLLRLPDDQAKARSWLAAMERQVSFGDELPAGYGRTLAFTCSGLRKMGLPERHIAEFPIAFRQGMDHPHRAAAMLRDTGEDKPANWRWGHGQACCDAALTLYAAPSSGRSALNAEIARQLATLDGFGGREVHRVEMKTVPEGNAVEAFGFVDGVSQPLIRGTSRWLKSTDEIHVVEAGEFILGYPDNRGYFPTTPTVPAADDPGNILPVVCSIRPDQDYPSFGKTSANKPHDLGANGSFLVIRQLEQDIDGFNGFTARAASEISGRPGTPARFEQSQLREWVAAKLVGRWRDGTSLVRHPHRPGTGWDGQLKSDPDNDFLLGQEDPAGHSCPFGAHIRRTNPRDSFEPGAMTQLAITNRHRILRIGRSYEAGVAGGGKPELGLLFMCLNADLERQFEFIQQTWVMMRLFHGLDGEVDSILGRGQKGGRLTIPSPAGPVTVAGMQSFVTMRGGGYFFMPGRAALRFLASGVVTAGLIA
jgi:deferrochelatase/peroxidase EfeB